MDVTPSLEFLDLQAAVAGRYSLDREIGRGGMGVVFLARDVALERPVAIKLLPPETATSRSLRERFLREARTAAKLSHPNIIPIFSVEEVNEFVFFVMAYVEGDTLSQRVGSRGPLPPVEAIRVLREVAWALAYAHAQGVVHRDVKPDNILLEKGSGRALVADFGIAKIAEGDAEAELAEVLGTPQFMSPEQATGESVDARSDVYSLGVVAFYVLSGKHPFDGETPSELLAHHIRTPAPSLSSAVPHVPRKVAAVVEQCLAKEPGDRLQSGEAVAEALGAVLDAPRVQPVPVRLFVEQSKARENRTLLYLVLALWIFPILLGMVWSPSIGGKVLGVGLGALMIGWPIVMSSLRVRRLLRAGYGREHLVQALELEVERRREELAFLYGPDFAKVAKKYRRIAYAALGVSLWLVGSAFAAPTIVGPLTIGAVFSAIVGVVCWRISDSRTDLKGMRRLRFWRGRLGRWLFKLAGVGSDREPEPAPLTHLATEIAVGKAVEGLFEALPRETRESLNDLPQVVQGLEADARRMRERVEELSGLLANAGEGLVQSEATDVLAHERRRAVERIRTARDEAQSRLSATIGALENLRIDLLRMRGGTANLESVTANLGSARELAAQIERLLQGHEEIERALSD